MCKRGVTRDLASMNSSSAFRFRKRRFGMVSIATDPAVSAVDHVWSAGHDNDESVLPLDGRTSRNPLDGCGFTSTLGGPPQGGCPLQGQVKLAGRDGILIFKTVNTLNRAGGLRL
ncbi:unnamed protein product [Ectocarpus sp. 4 AP-2014]